MEKINLCLLGCGEIAKMHSRVARSLRSQVNLLYASRDVAKAQAYNRRFKGVGAFGSYEEACASEQVDAVFICTPHAHHVEHARLAAAHRKPMLIEKPVTRSLAELDELEAVVEEASVLCMVAENYLFKPLTRKLRTILDNGDIGEVMFVELNRINRSKTRGWRADAEMMGGGALLEGGVHWINLLVSLGGEVERVIAAKPDATVAPTAPFEDSLQVLCKFRNGGVGRLLHSWNILNRIGGLSLSKIYGTAGNIHFESNGLFVLLLGKRKRFYLPGLLDLMGFRAMLSHFLACVRDGSTPAMSLSVARRDLALVEAAYRTLDSHKFETL